MKIDPAVVKIFAENVRADIIQRPAGINLDSAIVQKISARVKVFKDMNIDCLMSTLAMGEHQPHKAGAVVFNEGDIGSSFHIVVSGEVVVEKNKNGQVVPLARLGAGECFGEMALVDQSPRTASAVAETECALLAINRAALIALVKDEPAVGLTMLRSVAARLRHMNALLS